MTDIPVPIFLVYLRQRATALFYKDDGSFILIVLRFIVP